MGYVHALKSKVQNVSSGCNR